MPRVWVRYELPVMVLVELDEREEREEIRKVVICDEREEIALARDFRGHFLAYDAAALLAGEGRDEDGPRSLPTDTWPGMRAITVAEGDRWPEPLEWDHGPDPLRDPDFYDEVPEEDLVDAEEE